MTQTQFETFLNDIISAVNPDARLAARKMAQHPSAPEKMTPERRRELLGATPLGQQVLAREQATATGAGVTPRLRELYACTALGAATLEMLERRS